MIGTFHTSLHTLLGTVSDALEAHLVVATILSALLIASTFFIRDARIRRAASLAALIVFLVPMPDILPERSLQSLQLPLFDMTVDATASSSRQPAHYGGLDAGCIALGLWFAVCAILLARTIRDVRASSHEGVLLPEAERLRLGLPDSVTVRVSANGDGPHVAGLLRPVIVVPQSLVATSDEQELRAVLLHELTHVHQRDNLWGTISALITSVFWFHPLTWLAALRFRASSEVACDAAVLQAGIPLQTYLESLRKLIATAPSERVAQMALGGGSLKERIRIMKTTPRTMSRFAARLAIVTIALVTLGAGLSLRAMVGGDSPMSSALASGDTVTAYRIAHEITPLPDGKFQAQFAVIDLSAQRLLGVTGVNFIQGEPVQVATGQMGSGPDDVHLWIKLEPTETPGNYVGTAEIRRAGELVEKELEISVSEAPEPARPLDLKLTEAKLQDVLDLFAKLLQSELVVAADIANERVTVNLDDVPWDRALDDILLGRDLKWRKIGDLLIVSGNGNGSISKRPEPATEKVAPLNQKATVNKDVQPPKVIEQVDPVYTTEAKNARIQGLVIVEVSVDENGIPGNVRVIKPLPMGLAEAAADAVRQWRFSPATLNGERVPFIFNVTINFTLPEVTEG